MITIATDPNDQKVLSAAAMMNMDGEGLGDVRDYYRKQLVRMGVIKPTEEEAKALMAEMQGQQPDPQSLFFEASAQQAQAQAVKAHADATLAMAKAEESRAKSEAIVTNLNREGRTHVVETAQKLNDLMSPNLNITK